MGAQYDDAEQALQTVINAVRTQRVFHTLVHGTPFSVTWTGDGCRCDLASGGTVRISGDRFRYLLKEMQNMEVVDVRRLMRGGPERYALAVLAASGVHGGLRRASGQPPRPLLPVPPALPRRLVPVAPPAAKNPPREQRAAMCRHGKATLTCPRCRQEQPIDAHMVMAHVLSLVANRSHWSTDEAREVFDAYVDNGGLRFVTKSRPPVHEPRHALVDAIRTLLSAYHSGRPLHSSMVPEGIFLVPLVRHAIDPVAAIPDLHQDHRLRAYVSGGWPRQRLLWLAAALDWGPTPPSLAVIKGQAWRDAHKQLYPGGSPKSEAWQTLSDSVCKRDGWRCNACGEGETHLEVDHIQSLSRGGSNQPDNLWALCGDCHLTKTRMSKRVNWLDAPKAYRVRERTLS